MKYKTFTDGARQIIKTQAAIKIVNVIPNTKIDDPDNPDPGGAHNLVKQLAQPEKYRPVRGLEPGTNRANIFNPKTKEWETRVVKPKRGMPKPVGWEFTKNSSTTVLPPHGKMKLFRGSDPGNPPIGFLFDITQCDRKDDKYIGRGDLGTRMKWWLDYSNVKNQYTQPEKAALLKERGALQLSLEDLQKELNNAAENNQKVAVYNEAYIGLSSASLQALFLPSENLTYQMVLAVIQMNLECQQYLGTHLPILIIDEENGFRELTNKEQVSLLQEIKEFYPEESDRAKTYLEEILKSEANAFNHHQNSLQELNSNTISNLKEKYQTLKEIAHKQKDESLSEMATDILHFLDAYQNTTDDSIKTTIAAKIATLDTLYEIYKLSDLTLAKTNQPDQLIQNLAKNMQAMDSKEIAVINKFMISNKKNEPQLISEIRKNNEKFLHQITQRINELEKSIGLGRSARLNEWKLIRDQAMKMVDNNPLTSLKFDSVINKIGKEKLNNALELKSQGFFGKIVHKDSKNVKTINALKGVANTGDKRVAIKPATPSKKLNTN